VLHFPDSIPALTLAPNRVGHAPSLNGIGAIYYTAIRNPIDPNKREMEDIWRERVREARDRYTQAAELFRATWDKHFDTQMNRDGVPAIQRAREAESRALAEYVRVMKIFANLVISGQIPPEE
jgi:hypothetical protein